MRELQGTWYGATLGKTAEASTMLAGLSVTADILALALPGAVVMHARYLALSPPWLTFAEQCIGITLDFGIT